MITNDAIRVMNAVIIIENGRFSQIFITFATITIIRIASRMVDLRIMPFLLSSFRSYIVTAMASIDHRVLEIMKNGRGASSCCVSSRNCSNFI